MPFQNKSFGLHTSDVYLPNEETRYNNSALRIGPKCDKKRLIDAFEPELVQKKRNLDDPINNSQCDNLTSQGHFDLIMGQKNCNTMLLIHEYSTQALGRLYADESVNISPNADSKANPSSKKNKGNCSKKASANSFPDNVKTLLSTGIFEGVPVKYVSWKRDVTLPGIIEECGYICSCEAYNHTKPLTALEFECHAGGCSKQPHKYIYFANGKSMLGVVRELKNTPLEQLFDAIQNVSGSPINQTKFRSWKESFQAATRELQRIYGNAELTPPSER